MKVEEEVTPGTEKNGGGKDFEGFEGFKVPASRALRAAARSTNGAGVDFGFGAAGIGEGVGLVEGLVGLRNLSLSPLSCSRRSSSFSSFVFV